MVRPVEGDVARGPMKRLGAAWRRSTETLKRSAAAPQ
jgi:hypothetical protein